MTLFHASIVELLDYYMAPIRESLHDPFEAYILPVVSKGQRLERHSKISISAAVVLCSLYLYYHKITTPPRSLRHLPRASFFQVCKANFQNKSIEKYAQEVTLPLALKTPGGLHARLDGRGWAVHIAGSGAVKQFLQNIDLFPKFGGSRKGIEKTLMARFGHGSLTFSNGHVWKSQRLVALSAFRRSTLNNGIGVLITKLFDVMDKNLNQGALDVPDLTHRFALECLGLGIFGVDFDAIQNSSSEWVIQYNSIIKHAFDPFFLAYPVFDTTFLFLFPERRKVHQILGNFNQKIEEIVANKRRTVNQKQQPLDHEKDLLTLMIEADQEGDDSMTDASLRDVQKQARKQVIAVLGDPEKDITPSVDQLRAMPYINMVIKETLRIKPPGAFSAPHIAVQDTELAGTRISRGTLLILDIYELHHNPTIWKDPHSFNPDRFADGGEAEQVGSSGWLPFIGGPRQCLAMNFSLALLRVSLAMFLRKYEWSLPEKSIHKDNLVTTDILLATPKDLKLDFRKRY